MLLILNGSRTKNEIPIGGQGMHASWEFVHTQIPFPLRIASNVSEHIWTNVCQAITFYDASRFSCTHFHCCVRHRRLRPGRGVCQRFRVERWIIIILHRRMICENVKTSRRTKKNFFQFFLCSSAVLLLVHTSHQCPLWVRGNFPLKFLIYEHFLCTFILALQFILSMTNEPFRVH